MARYLDGSQVLIARAASVSINPFETRFGECWFSVDCDGESVAVFPTMAEADAFVAGETPAPAKPLVAFV